MQHRIIGPVVLTVHEYWTKGGAMPVLKPGNYSRVPSIAHWKAHGHILTDEAEADHPEKTFAAHYRKPRRAGLPGMAEPEDAQRGVPAAGACAYGTRPGTGDGGMEEVRDGGLRLVGSTLPTLTVRLLSETPATEYRESAAPRCPDPPSAEFHRRSWSADNISSLLFPKPTLWTGCRNGQGNLLRSERNTTVSNLSPARAK